MGRIRAKVRRSLSARNAVEKPVVRVDPRQLALAIQAALHPIVNPSRTLAQLAEDWLPRKRGQISSGGDFEARLRNHLLPLLGHHTDQTLRPKHIDELVAQLVLKKSRYGKPLSAQSIKHIWDTGRQLINDAKANGEWASANPFVNIHLPRIVEAEREMLTAMEAGRVLRAIAWPWRPLFATAIYLGPRRGELFATRKEDVNTERGYVSFRGSHEKEFTKTGKRRLHIPIPDELTPFIATALSANPASEWLFPSATGKRLTRDTRLCDVLRAALGVVGVAGRLTFHGLRRVSATLHQEAGCHPWVVSKVLGHSQANLMMAENMTARVYTQFSEAFVRRELNRLTLNPQESTAVLNTSPESARSSAWIEHRPSKPAKSGSQSGRVVSPEFLADHGPRFWLSVKKARGNGCWLWTGPTQPTNRAQVYGHFRVEGETFLAHRISYELTHGPLKPGQVVMHTCDLPLCVRPGHLSAGTQAQNRADCVNKHRQARGEGNGRAKLSVSDVSEIRAAWETTGVAELARKYGVSQRAIRFAAEGTNWKHIKGGGDQ